MPARPRTDGNDATVAVDNTDVSLTRAYGVRTVRGPFVRLQPHPRSCTTETQLVEMSRHLHRPKAVDLFCGAGGLSLGLADAGYEVILGVDNDQDALETHRANHPGMSVLWDLSDDRVVEHVGLLVRKLGVDLLAGGPPCQAFSRAGRPALKLLVRNGARPSHDQRRDLWQSFLRVVAIARPPAVLLENVPEMALETDMWILRSLIDELEVMGYSVEERIVATSDYGVPQFRHRLILVALAGGLRFVWPTPTKATSLRNAIGDLPPVDGGFRPANGDDPADPVASGWVEYSGPPHTEFRRRMRRDVPESALGRVYDHITRPVRDDDARAFAVMDSSTRYSDLDEGLRRYRADIFDDKYKRLDWNGFSRTITAHIAKDGYGFIHPEQERTLTVREAARVQTFSDDIRFAGPPSSAFRQIGNAVPPFLGKHLGTAIRAAMNENVRAARRTRDISRLLADWFLDRDPLTVPWLRAETRWQVIVSELLWARLPPDAVREAWSATRPLNSPTLMLAPANLRALERYASIRGRSDRLILVEETARWFLDKPSALDAESPLSTLRLGPNIAPSTAALAVRVCPGARDDREDPIVTSHGVVRVVARVFGEGRYRTNKGTDARLGVARMVGGEDSSHEAHLGLIELAASVCVSGGHPDCPACPLLDLCDYGRALPARRAITNRAG